MPKYKFYTGKKKKSSDFNRLQIEVLFLPYISLQNMDPSNLSFVCIYAQEILTGFYGM